MAALLLFSALMLQLSAYGFAMQRGCPTGTSNYTYANAQLPLPYDGYLPAIDNETMFLHLNRHAGAAVNNYNAILARYPQLQELPLAEIVQKIGLRDFNAKYKILANDSTALRNNGGSMYNHGIFWRIMTRYNTSSPSDLSPELSGLIASTWNSTTGMLNALRASGSSLFGSGWSWLIYRTVRGKPRLAIVNTPNQDNPIMRYFVADVRQGIPILGVDVWEHAYYLSYRNVRAAYLAQWVNLIDWTRVQKNYELAKQGRIDNLYC